MGLEDPVTSTGHLVWRLAVKWRAGLDRALAPLGLTSAQYAVLASLSGLSRSGAQPNQRQLADFAGLEPMFVSKLVRALEKAGLVTRHSNPADPRARQLEVTARGREVVTAGRAVVMALEEQRLAVIGGPASRDSAMLNDTLRTLLGQADTSPGT